MLEMALFYISKNPQVETKLRDEIKSVMKDDIYDAEHLKELKYVDAVVKETLRIYGPANLTFLRDVVKDCIID